MANDIKQKIVLEGEKEYNKALSEAKRNLKTLRSELKAETAELGNNATAQQKNETRIKSLQKQIKEQEKIVKTYKEALKEVKEKYGDNEDAVAKWEQKLNDARTSLANMKNELDNVGKSFKDVQGSADMATVASRSVAESLGSIAEVGGAISDGIESVFTGLLESVKSTLTEIWGMIADTAAKANNWTDLASYYGTSAEQIERMNKAIEWTQGNFGDFTNLLNQLAWGGKNKKITEWFGISDANYVDKLEYAQAVLQEMSNLSKNDPGKLEKAMEDIFGAKKSQQIMWFVSNLEQINANLKDYDEKGYGMGKDALAEMNEVWLELGKIEGKWKDLKQQFAAGFGKTTLDIMVNVEGTIDALNAYLNAGTPEERDQALWEIEENVLAMFEAAAGAISEGIEILDQVAKDLQGSDNPTAQALGNVLGGLVDVLKWFTEDNMTNVVRALEILAGFWIAGKGLQMASTIAELAANIRTLSFMKLITGGGAGGLFGGATEAGLTANAITSAITASSGGLASAIATALTSTAGVIGVGVMTMAPVLIRLLSNNDKLVQEYMKKLDEATGTTKVEKKVENAVKNGYDALHYLVTGETKKVEEAVAQAGQVDTSGFTLPTKKTPRGTLVGYKLTDEQRQGLEDYWDYSRKDDAWNELAQEEKLTTLFSDNMDTLNKLMDMITILQTRDGWTTLEDLPSEWWQHQGGNTGNTEGITSIDAQNMTGAVKQMPQAVAKALSGLSVRMDGQTVGYIVAPYVSQQIASQIGG